MPRRHPRPATWRALANKKRVVAKIMAFHDAILVYHQSPQSGDHRLMRDVFDKIFRHEASLPDYENVLSLSRRWYRQAAERI